MYTVPSIYSNYLPSTSLTVRSFFSSEPITMDGIKDSINEPQPHHAMGLEARVLGCSEPLIYCSTSPFSGLSLPPAESWPRGCQGQVQMSAYYCETRVFYVPLQDGPGLIIKLVLLLNSEQFLLEWRRKRRGRMDFFLFPVLVSIPPSTRRRQWLQTPAPMHTLKLSNTGLP